MDYGIDHLKMKALKQLHKSQDINFENKKLKKIKQCGICISLKAKHAAFIQLKNIPEDILDVLHINIASLIIPK